MQSTRSSVRRFIVVLPVAMALTAIPATSAANGASIGPGPRLAAAGAGLGNTSRARVAAINRVSAVVPLPPAITSLSPNTAAAGGAAFTLTINGIRFTASSALKWGTVALATKFRSASQLTASIPAGLVATAGTASITVVTAGGVSSGAAFTITQPLPEITSLNPTSATTGRAFTMTINGKNFASQTTAKWNATPLTITYVGASQLTASVPAGLVAAGGKALVTVSTAGRTSPAVELVVSQPAPIIASLSPNSVVAGAQTFTLTINGANFLPGSAATVARWNYTALTTTFVNSTQITAAIPASLTGGAATANISVVTTAGQSSSIPFTVTPALPVVTGISPSRLPAGYSAFTLFVYGTHFSSTATVNWGGTPLITAPLGGSTLTAKVPASLVASLGSADVTVTTAGGTSAPFTFSISQPQPVITSLSPASALAGGVSFTMTIKGANFISTSYCIWQSTHLATNYVSATQLTVTVPSSMIASAGTRGIEVNTPGGAGFSMAADFIVMAAPPAISNVTPGAAMAGSAGFMLTINGTAFTPATTTMWGTTPLGTTYSSPTQLIAAVPASLIVNPGTGTIKVTTQAGTSNPASFTILPARPCITGLGPGRATAGGPAFTLTVSGQYFTTASTVKWASTVLTTTYVSTTELTAAVPARLIASAGANSITVTASAGTSGPATFTVYPAPKITTATIPSATAGAPYSGPISVTGGVPGYRWTVKGLPSSFSFFNTSGNTLTIVGIPTTHGTVNFQVSVQDASGATAGPVSYVLDVASGPNGANNSRLNGSYVCLLQGFIDDDGSRWASLASFQADGNGNLASGVVDTNSQDIGSASGTITGSYSVGSDMNGFASLRTVLTEGAAGILATKWALAIASASAPAHEFRMVEADDLGELPSGQQGTADCNLATPSAFAAASITGSSFAFGIEGENRSGTLKAAAGLFSASAGKIVSGDVDQVQGGNETLQSTSISGTYTVPDDVTGRFKIALNAGGSLAGLTVYIIDANRMFILDNTSNDGEQAGSMRKQQQSSYSAANISGPLVLSIRGAEFDNDGGTPSGYYADVLEGNGDGKGNLAMNENYSNDNGVYLASRSNASPIALGFAQTGRVSFQSASGSTYLYLFDNNSAFGMGVGDNGSLNTGWLEPQELSQTQPLFANPGMNGNSLVGEMPLLNLSSNGFVGEFDLTGSGPITGALTTSGQNILSWDQAASMSYSSDATDPTAGTFLIAGSTQGAASCAIVNSTRSVCMPQTDPTPNIEVMQQ